MARLRAYATVARVSLMSAVSYRASAGGIIDIRTKRGLQSGFNATLDTGYRQGRRDTENAGITLNYRRKGFNVFGNYSATRTDGWMEVTQQNGTRGADVEVRVVNTGRAILLEGAEVSFYGPSGLLGTASLQNPVYIPAKRQSLLRSRWRFDMPDVASAYVLQKRFEAGECEDIEVKVYAWVHIGWRRRVFSIDRMPLCKFLTTFEATKP